MILRNEESVDPNLFSESSFRGLRWKAREITVIKKGYLPTKKWKVYSFAFTPRCLAYSHFKHTRHPWHDPIALSSYTTPTSWLHCTVTIPPKLQPYRPHVSTWEHPFGSLPAPMKLTQNKNLETYHDCNTPLSWPQWTRSMILKTDVMTALYPLHDIMKQLSQIPRPYGPIPWPSCLTIWPSGSQIMFS